MSAEPDSTEPSCSGIKNAVSVLGDKWSGFIITELRNGPQRFSELEKTLGIGPRTLSQRLDSMEQHGIVQKQSFAEVPPRVEYSLTKKGKDLLPILGAMVEWGAKHTG